MLGIGSALFYGGIGGMGVSLIVGLVIFASLANKKSKIREDLERRYRNKY